jgi:hypothetical protein
MKRLLLVSACLIFLCWSSHEAAAQRRSSPMVQPAVSFRVPQPVNTFRPFAFPQYYIKDSTGFPIPVVPVFVVPVVPPPASAPVAKPACYRFFCD